MKEETAMKDTESILQQNTFSKVRQWESNKYQSTKLRDNYLK